MLGIKIYGPNISGDVFTTHWAVWRDGPHWHCTYRLDGRHSTDRERREKIQPGGGPGHRTAVWATHHPLPRLGSAVTPDRVRHARHYSHSLLLSVLAGNKLTTISACVELTGDKSQNLTGGKMSIDDTLHYYNDQPWEVCWTIWGCN